VDVLQRIMRVLDSAPLPPEPAPPEIGFHVKEDAPPYRVGTVHTFASPPSCRAIAPLGGATAEAFPLVSNRLHEKRRRAICVNSEDADMTPADTCTQKLTRANLTEKGACA
jgi:hypothetical protein